VFADPSTSFAAASVPRCTDANLEVATAWGSGADAGHFGIPFLIVNTSPNTCYLDGYPKLSISTIKSPPHRIIVSHGSSGFYADIKPRRVVLVPNGVASFGVSAVDALDQSYGDRASCTVDEVYTQLPVAGLRQNYQNAENFNICFSGFRVVVSAIQAGPSPKII